MIDTNLFDKVKINKKKNMDYSHLWIKNICLKK
jgi:hypothetical protein